MPEAFKVLYSHTGAIYDGRSLTLDVQFPPRMQIGYFHHSLGDSRKEVLNIPLPWHMARCSYTLSHDYEQFTISKIFALKGPLSEKSNTLFDMPLPNVYSDGATSSYCSNSYHPKRTKLERSEQEIIQHCCVNYWNTGFHYFTDCSASLRKLQKMAGETVSVTTRGMSIAMYRYWEGLSLKEAIKLPWNAGTGTAYQNALGYPFPGITTTTDKVA